MPNFNSADGDLTTVFITDSDVIGRYVQDGTLWAAGFAGSGRLANGGTSGTNNAMFRTAANTTNWSTVCGSGGNAWNHHGGVKTNGTLWMWGGNAYGQLGQNDRTDRSTPVQVGTESFWVQLSFSDKTILAIRTDGTLWGWGVGGNVLPSGTTRSSPVLVYSGGSTWKQISAGGSTGGVKTDGTLWTWGENSWAQLGVGDTTTRTTPVQVGTDTAWKQVAMHGSLGLASHGIKTDGTLWGWGSNAYGGLGIGATGDFVTKYSTPVQIVSGTSDWKTLGDGAARSSAAIKTDGTLWVWGRNANGELGTNDTTIRSTPVQTIAGGSNWKTIHFGSYGNAFAHTKAIKSDGTLWAWGHNGYGQLGIGNTSSQSSPVQIGTDTNWKTAACGYNCSFAVKYPDRY